MAYYEGYTQSEIASRLDIALGTVKTRTSRGLQRLAALLESGGTPGVNGHVFDELPQLLTGEADRATVAAVAAHLRDCDDCRDELIAAVAAHAALTSAAQFAPGTGRTRSTRSRARGPIRRATTDSGCARRSVGACSRRCGPRSTPSRPTVTRCVRQRVAPALGAPPRPGPRRAAPGWSRPRPSSSSAPVAAASTSP